LETQESEKSQGNTHQKEQCLRFQNTQLQTLLQSNSNKNSRVLAKNGHEEQWNRIEDPDMKPHSYAHLIFENVTQTYDGEKTASSTNISGKTSCQFAKLKQVTALSSCTSINSKWI
jgi:hypothetical protein